jgi:hypothetical protein
MYLCTTTPALPAARCTGTAHRSPLHAAAHACLAYRGSRSPHGSLCRLLASASNPNRSAGEDICNHPPFVCDSKGRLLRFPAPHAGFNCQGDLRPWATFSKLEMLELSSAAIGATTQAVGAMVAKLPNLKKINLQSARISGPMTCDMIGTSMKVRHGSSVFRGSSVQACSVSHACGVVAPACSSMWRAEAPAHVPPPAAAGAAAPAAGRLLLLVSDLPPVSRCARSDSPAVMQVMAMHANGLTGTLPECYFRGTSLAELYVSANSIQGPLPDAFEGSKMAMLYAESQEGRMLNGGCDARAGKCLRCAGALLGAHAWCAAAAQQQGVLQYICALF